jgi:ferredoxin-NADP reductase
MTAVYWERDEYDCTAESRAISVATTEHHHVATDREAIRLYLSLYDSRDAHWNAGRRYHCICGPHGMLRGVRATLRATGKGVKCG